MSNRIYGEDPDYHRELPTHQWHSDTSTEAAEEIIPRLKRLTDKVFNNLGHAGEFGVTDDEGMMHIGVDGNSYRPRRIALMHRGLVRDSDLRRLTRRNRNAVVWELTELGRRIYEQELKAESEHA